MGAPNTIEQPKLHYYHFTVEKDRPFGWVRAIIGPGFFMAVSDYGHVAANWGPQSPGTDFRRYFAKPGGISPDYFCEKTGQGKTCFDAEATVKRLRKLILESRREKRWSRDFARGEWDLTTRMEGSELGWEGWLAETEIGDAIDDVVWNYPVRLRGFAENVLPDLAKVVAAELETEVQRNQEGTP